MTRLTPTVIGRRSPHLRSTLAATSAARLAEASQGEALWRAAPAGSVEIVTLTDGVFRRHIVQGDGAMHLADEVPPTVLERCGKRIAVTGWLFCLIAIVVLGVTAPEGADRPSWAVLFFVLLALGAVLFIVGGGLSSRYEALGSRLKRVGLPTDGWRRAPDLDGWMPVSTAQLAAVEELAEAYGGVAHVRAGVRGEAEVLVRRGTRVVTLWVNASGDSGVVEDAAAGRHTLAWHAKHRPVGADAWYRVDTRLPQSD